METVLLHQMVPPDPRSTLSLDTRDVLGNILDDGSLSDGGDSTKSGTPLMSDANLWRLQDIPLPPLPSFEVRSRLQKYPPNLSIKSHRPKKSRSGLPVTIHREGISATVISCANTSADANIISDEVARKLGLSRADEVPARKEFVLADGKTVEASGRIDLTCSFGTETKSLVMTTCTFYVVPRSATPAMIGLGFLVQTRIITEQRERLLRVPTSAFQALSLRYTDRSKQLLTCELNHVKTLATPGFRSEVDMISPSFVSERSLRIYPGEDTIELADGSMIVTSGYVCAKLSIASTRALGPGSRAESSITIKFALAKDLLHDILVSRDSLEELEIFKRRQDALISAPLDCRPLGLNRRRRREAKRHTISGITQDIEAARSRNWDDGEYTSPSIRAYYVKDLTDNATGDTRTSRDTSIIDQREQNRRESEVATIARLPWDARQAAIENEANRQDTYARELYFSSRPDPLACEQPGCDAEPMWTQQLLEYVPQPMPVTCANKYSSHVKTHYLRRLHYCPVSSCSRSEGGEGFKRKVEMIRHGIVHQSLAYVCPFCPAGYLQPNSLAQ